jgi:electron transfer flavoprotein beta subunit
MSELNIIVCIKQVPDPEAPISGYRIDSEARRVTPVGVPPVISPFDENALELALRLKETHGGKVTVFSAGPNLSQAVLRKALFVGADELILIDAPASEEEIFDSRGTAFVLSEAIKRVGSFNIILTGRQAADTNAGLVGFFLAEFLQIPAVALVKNMVIEGGKARIERILPDGFEVVEAQLPILGAVSSEAGELRNLDMKQMREAKKKPILKWSGAEIVSIQQTQRNFHLRALTAPRRERNCAFIEAATLAEAGEKLAIKLREDKVI